MLNKILRAGADPAVDGGEAQHGFVHLSPGPRSPTDNKDKSRRGGVCIKGSQRRLLVPKPEAARDFRVTFAASVVRRLGVGAAICGRPAGGP